MTEDISEFSEHFIKGINKVGVVQGNGNKCFIAKANSVTGNTEWIFQDFNYDFHQEIARSKYADMLHDSERNAKYFFAIKKAVSKLKASGKQVNVLDIGAGTGLLSMMAIAAGADSVSAFEAFEPVASCADSILKRNGFDDKIKLHHARSTDSSPDCCSMQLSNLLVTEIFDTELIGEGAIATFNHAHRHLLKSECIVIPRAANVYIQPVSSNFIRNWNDLKDINAVPGHPIKIPKKFSTCSGASILHDLQLNMLDEDLFIKLSNYAKAYRFNFDHGDIPCQEKKEIKFVADYSGRVDAILMWWDLEMDYDGLCVLSCAPNWAHPSSVDVAAPPWRDHWMQAIFYPATPHFVHKGTTFSIFAQHDEYSLWFEMCPLERPSTILDRQFCHCGLHLAFSRSRIGMLNDASRNMVFFESLKQHINKDTVCLCISEGSLIPFFAASLGAKKVFVVDNNTWSISVCQDIIMENNAQDKIKIISKPMNEIESKDFDYLQVDLLVGEPCFSWIDLPWDTMHFWYAAKRIINFFTPNITILPTVMIICAMAMQFTDLWKIRAPVGICEGFDLQDFDNITQESSVIADKPIETQSLWEYSGIVMSKPVDVLQIPFHLISAVNEDLCFVCERGGLVNGVALWCDMDFDNGLITSTGPLHSPLIGQQVQWNYYHRQAVHFCHSPFLHPPNAELTFHINFDHQQGKLKFIWDF